MNAEKEIINCPLCDSSEHRTTYEPWIEISDPLTLYGAASSIPGTQRIVTCTDCDLLYENPRFPENVIVQGYQQSKEGGHDSQYSMRVRSFLKALGKVKDHLPARNARILDIGTAGGAFLEAATQFGYQASGLEPSQFLVERGLARGFDVKQGTIERNPFPKQTFDMITMWDVIEHMANPKQALLTIKEWLKPNGILLLNYPDIGTWQAKLAGKRFWWIISGHLVHFSKQTMTDILKRTGFEVRQYKSYWQTLEFGYLEERAIHYSVPLSRFLHRWTPESIRRLPIPYYASQTTVIAQAASK